MRERGMFPFSLFLHYFSILFLFFTYFEILFLDLSTDTLSLFHTIPLFLYLLSLNFPTLFPIFSNRLKLIILLSFSHRGIFSLCARISDSSERGASECLLAPSLYPSSYYFFPHLLCVLFSSPNPTIFLLQEIFKFGDCDDAKF